MRRIVGTPLRAGAVIVAAALAMLLLGGAFGRPAPAPAGETTGAREPTAVDRLEQNIAQAQDRLRRVPGDWVTWASLGMSYLEHARITTDPTYYPKAEEAVHRSLTVKPKDNVEGLVARGALANARHDFGAARRDAKAAIAINGYHADAYAVLADAETQLGHATEATTAIRRLLDLRPGLSGYARASYDLEQHGQTAEAIDLMRRALDVAVDRHDVAFCRNQLGDLALNAGDVAGASTEYAAGLAADPTSVALQRGQARAAAASGDLTKAVSGYAALTRRAPTPSYLIEYAELLRAAGRDAGADAQLRLATAAHQLFTANGGVDGLTGAQLAIATGRFADAVKEARAEWSRRTFADVADMLGWALHLSKKDKEALVYAKRAFAAGATSAQYAYHLGMIELALGDRAAARTHLERALAINPAFSPIDAPAARGALTALESSS